MPTQRDGLSGLQPPPHLHRRVTSFRSRRAALTDSQQRTWARLWPTLGAEARLTARSSPVDTAAWFGRSAPVVLEIGCGTGISTAAMAKAEPDVDVVAVEVYKRGLAQLLGAIEREQITNIRLIRGDGLDVLEHMFGTESLTGVRVFFPDPWPKSRHHKRRLLQPGTVELIADRLNSGGILHVATDHEGYAEQIEAVGDGQPRLRRAQPGVGHIPDLGAAADHEVRVQGAACRKRRRRAALGEAMSLTDEIPVTTAADAEVAPAPARVLLVWDAPNLDMGLVDPRRPAHRRLPAPLRRAWALVAVADGRAGHRPHRRVAGAEATVFTNIAPGSADVVRPWVEALRNVGFAVFAKPKVDDDSDVDEDMLNHIAARHSEGLAGVLVASADGQAFRQPLEDIAGSGVAVEVRDFANMPAGR